MNGNNRLFCLHLGGNGVKCLSTVLAASWKCIRSTIVNTQTNRWMQLNLDNVAQSSNTMLSMKANLHSLHP
ncbi:hypothetical protein RIF29_40685 [Crotalaria pallida]|uniref:Uncharacterized protein n=1 Tax=Crotalaria pallida TaxID=3830 RepID=A0AAN9E3J6_CROPI